MDVAVTRDINELRFITKDEANYLYSIRPVPLEYLAVSFQDALRHCLLEYLNTPYLITHKKSIAVRLLKKKYSELGIDIKELSTISRIKDLPTIIIYSYHQLELLLKRVKNIGQSKSVEIPKITKDYYAQFPVLKEYVEFSEKRLSKYLYASVIHGSCSDLELTRFSDLDTFLVINKATVGSKKKLIEFKKYWTESLKFLYRFDSLQHHNHLIASEYDLKFFPYHWLPPQVFAESTLIYGTPTLKLKIFKSDFFNLKVFFSLAHRFRDPQIGSKIQNEYSLKNDISILSLIPVLYLQTIGFDVTKKESFNHKKILEIDSNSLYKKISEIRRQWKVSSTSVFIVSKLYNYYLRKLYIKYFIGTVELKEITHNSKIKESFVLELKTLINKMSTNIIEGNK
tara:strand:- start:8061 stop:9254 length:1194 start_codon:yes stop_codon:yes gene_type:complete